MGFAFRLKMKRTSHTMKKVVVKIGGSLAIDEAKLADFVSAVSTLPGSGCQVAVVHGGARTLTKISPCSRNNRHLSTASESRPPAS